MNNPDFKSEINHLNFSERLTTRFVFNKNEDIVQQLWQFQEVLFGKNVCMLTLLQDIREGINGSCDNFFGYYPELPNYVQNIYYFLKLKQKYWTPSLVMAHSKRQYELECDNIVLTFLNIIIDMLSDFMDEKSIDRKSIVVD